MIVDLYKSGMGLAELSSEYGIEINYCWMGKRYQRN